MPRAAAKKSTSVKKEKTPEKPVVASEPDESIECGICGKAGGPNVQCGICHGHAPTQSRAYTLSDVRSGRAPDDGRYGPGGSVSPTVVTLPGSAR